MLACQALFENGQTASRIAMGSRPDCSYGFTRPLTSGPALGSCAFLHILHTLQLQNNPGLTFLFCRPDCWHLSPISPNFHPYLRCVEPCNLGLHSADFRILNESVDDGDNLLGCPWLSWILLKSLLKSGSIALSLHSIEPNDTSVHFLLCLYRFVIYLVLSLAIWHGCSEIGRFYFCEQV